MISNISKSGLKLNQKLDALRRFVIPTLDYMLTEGTPRIEDQKKLDVQMRQVVADHIGAQSIPINLASTHWKDGGLSLQTLENRSKALEVKAFVSLYNSSSENTRTLIRDCVEEERNIRGVKKVNSENSKFLDWETDPEGKIIAKHKGIATAATRAKIAADKMNISIMYTHGKKLALAINGVIIEAETGKKVAAALMKRDLKTSLENFIQMPVHGHSFHNLVNAPNYNAFVGNYSNNISDKVITFAIAARSNTLYTGYIPHFRSNYSPNEDPGCPYCHVKGARDTLFNRLNHCKISLPAQTNRHNLVCKELWEMLKKTNPNAIIRQNS
jgi:hypothetical protein